MQEIATADANIAQTPKVTSTIKSAVKKGNVVKKDPAQARPYTAQEIQTFLDSIQTSKSGQARPSSKSSST
jgi:hypothetical protein